MVNQQKRYHLLRNNALELQKEAQDARKKQLIQTEGVIYINN
jgi:hypothetical protein